MTQYDEEYEIIEEEEDFFGLGKGNGGKIIYISAAKGAGKSGHTAGIKKLKKRGLLTMPKYLQGRFDCIFLIHRAYSKDKEYWKLKLHKEHIIEECSFENIQAIYEYCMESWEENEEHHSLIIFEDCLSVLQGFRNKTNENILDDMVSNSRGYNISIMISSQMFKACSTTVRSQIDYLIMFDTAGNEEYERLRVAFRPKRMNNNDEWDQTWDSIFQGDYDTMMIALRQKSKIYRSVGLDKVIDYQVAPNITNSKTGQMILVNH